METAPIELDEHGKLRPLTEDQCVAAFVHLPGIRVTGQFRTAGNLVRLLRHTMDARPVWVDPEPEYRPDHADD